MFTWDNKAHTLLYRGTTLDVANVIKDTKPLNDNCRRIYAHTVSNGDSDKWAGGDMDDALSMPDLAPFLNAKADLIRSGKLRKLKLASSLVNKRSRTLSEHDGDWSIERQWDLKPFSSTKRLKVPTPHVRIVADFCLSGGINSSDIDAYGAFVWSIAQILEDNGTSVSIELRNIAEHYGFVTDLTIVLKQSGTYISPQALAQGFRSVYYRRAIFALEIKGASLFNQPIDSGLGTPRRHGQDCEYANGTLSFKIGASNNPDQCMTIFNKIFKGGS